MGVLSGATHAFATSDVTGVMDHRESIQEGNSALGQVVERIST